MKSLTNVVTYIIRKTGTSIFKIGRTKHLANRIRTLTTMSGCNLEIIATFDGDVESSLHSKFSHIRGIGEWFHDEIGEIDVFLENEAEVSTIISIGKLVQKEGKNEEDKLKLLNVMLDKIFSMGDTSVPTPKLLTGTIGGDIAKELYYRLPSPFFFEESSHKLLGCEAIAFIFEDAVYSVAPDFGMKFSSLDEYIQYYEKGQEDFSVEEGTDIRDLPSWMDYSIFMRNHAQPMLEEINRLNT